MKKRRNPEAVRRYRMAAFLADCFKTLGVDPEEATKELGINASRIVNCRTIAQLRILHPLGAFIEARAREQASGS